MSTNSSFNKQSYPNQFLDIASSTLPNNIKELFQFIEFYAISQSLISTALKKKASYPVTSLIYDQKGGTRNVKERWKYILEDVLKFPRILDDINYNFYLYGNVFITIKPPIKKMLTCKSCKKEFEVSKLKEGSLSINNKTLLLERCPSCGMVNPPIEIQDIYLKDQNGLKLMIWNPNNIVIEYNELSGKYKYLYNIPKQQRTKINSMALTLEELSCIEQEYIEAALAGDEMLVRFNNNAIFHMKCSTISGKDPGWGYPDIVGLLKDLYYLQTIKKANEAVMHEHMLPYRYLYPNTSGIGDHPGEGINLTQWKSHMQKELERWKKDPNYISFLPFPAGQGVFGGQGKALLAQNEMNEMSKFILAGLSVPYEFMFGGLQWSGSNVSLRMMENEFMGMRDFDIRLLHFVIDRVSLLLGIPQDMDIHFSEFKMADDSQRKQYLLELYKQDMVSEETLLEEFSINREAEKKKIKEEDKQAWDKRKYDLVQEHKAQTEAQIEAQKVQINGQYELQQLQSRYGVIQQQQQQQDSSGGEEGGGSEPGIKQDQSKESAKSKPNEVKNNPESKPPRGENRQM